MKVPAHDGYAGPTPRQSPTDGTSTTPASGRRTIPATVKGSPLTQHRRAPPSEGWALDLLWSPSVLRQTTAAFETIAG